jgi:hypothetical protein
MTHAAFTPLLGREFDNFLFARIGDDRGGTLMSVVSALARLDVDPREEAVNLAGMPREQAMERLTTLLASLPKGTTASLSPELVAAGLIALLPAAAGLKAPAAAAPLPAHPLSERDCSLGSAYSRSCCLPLHIDGSSFKCAGMYSGLTCYGKRVCGATLTVRCRGG